jgi:hypothetical protein
MSVYHDLFEARFHEMKHDYHQANAARGYDRASALGSLIRRIASR